MIRTDIEIMKAELSNIRSDLKEKVGRDELAVLEARVTKLEKSHTQDNSRTQPGRKETIP